MTEYKVLTESRARKLGLCKRCNLPFKVGSRYESRHGDSHKYYHVECWARMFFDSPEASEIDRLLEETFKEVKMNSKTVEQVI